MLRNLRYMYTYIKIYLYKFNTKLCKFINKFSKYKISIYNLYILQFIILKSYITILTSPKH